MITNGWLDSAQILRSPHFNQRPQGEAVSLLVLHNISLPPGNFEQHFVEEFFCGKLDVSQHPYFQEIEGVRVSSHLYVRRDGELVQFVSFNERAWHAGESTFEGRVNCNDYSIGIELEGTDDIEYTEEQYRKLIQITVEIQAAFPKITLERIVGHCDIAPQRKTDPGASFDWQRYRSSLADR